MDSEWERSKRKETCNRSRLGRAVMTREEERIRVSCKGEDPPRPGNLILKIEILEKRLLGRRKIQDWELNNKNREQ